MILEQDMLFIELKAFTETRHKSNQYFHRVMFNIVDIRVFPCSLGAVNSLLSGTMKTMLGCE